jgi:lysosomal alpha-mannosidase
MRSHLSAVINYSKYIFVLQITKNIKSLLEFGVSDEKLKVLAGAIDKLEKAMGILQHHDAVAGTEKQAVANDYVYILHNAETEVQNVRLIFV